MPQTPMARQRRSDALRNDERILNAAREVFAEQGYRARMSTIADRAGVGMGTLYGRYPSKEVLLTRMNIAGMQRIISEAENAVAAGPDPWSAFATFMRNCVAAGAGAMLDLAGLTPPSPAQLQAANQLHDAIHAVVAWAANAGVLRPGVTPADVYLLFAQLVASASDDPRRARELRSRFLELLLDGLRATEREPLPGPPAQWQELRQRWLDA